MKIWTSRELIKSGYKIENARITKADLVMADHDFLTMNLILEGNGWGVVYGGFDLGRKNIKVVPDDDGDFEDATYITSFEGNDAGTEYIMTLMNVIGVDKFSELQGKYLRVATRNFWDVVKIVGNVIKDEWFDAETFFTGKDCGAKEQEA